MDFIIKSDGMAALHISGHEPEAVQIAVRNLAHDLQKVLPGIAIIQNGCSQGPDIFIRTLDGSAAVEAGLSHKEQYQLQVQDGALHITGNGRRGTIYGIYTLSELLGVSPWHFFADVPARVRQEFTLPDGFCKTDWPSVEYRGIFINDEEELDAWAQNYLGEPTIGLKTYEKVFELLLRLKANYIWPAMHVNSFNLNRENGALADRMGIVVGTSHCDMLMRSNNREWSPWVERKGYSSAKYDYSIPGRNREILQEYWRESVEQNRDFEVCYTLGMRGIHDSGFETRRLEGKSPEDIRKAKVELLETVIRDQREILHNTLGQDTLCTFIPYKEVLELYDAGLDVPEELTLVWANDNYGYVRRYPSQRERQRKGGNGIYYHNSYWSPPSMSYVFLCSIPLAHTRHELQKAWDEGIRKLWVLNVGAIKPLEQEINFFLDFAWEISKPDAVTEDVDDWVEAWIDRTFSGQIGKETARLLNAFSQLTNVRKLENMDYDVFSQTAYGDEAAVRIHTYEDLFDRGNALYHSLPEQERDAFFQLVLFRIHAAYFTNLQYYYGDRSTLQYNRGNMQAAALCTQRAMEFDDARRRLVAYYNRILAGGKWQGIINPEGFPPPRAAMMPVCTPPLSAGKGGLRIDVWNDEDALYFVDGRSKWFDIGNGGEEALDFEIEAPDWIGLSESQGRVLTEARVLVWTESPLKDQHGSIKIYDRTNGICRKVAVQTKQFPSGLPVEDGGAVSVAADTVPTAGTGFRLIKRLGRGQGDLVEAYENGAGLSYRFYLTSRGPCTLEIHRFPSLNATGRIRIGVSVDGGPVQVVESPSTDEWRGSWKANVLDNCDRLTLPVELTPGEHAVTFHPIDKYFAFSRFVIYTRDRKANNYIGIEGSQELPRHWDAAAWTRKFYGEIPLLPRPVEYARPDREMDSLAVSDLIRQEDHYAPGVEPDWYFQQGRSLFSEKNGCIKIDAAAALANSEFAWVSDGRWQHCSSESCGRTGLAMYIRQRGQRWQVPEVPSLHYKLHCEGGDYILWLLAKFGIQEESFFGAGIDGTPLAPEILYNKGCLWRYESEQIYRWVPIAGLKLLPGNHELALYSLASGLRFDRIYLTKEAELPPMDGEWRTT